MESQLHQKPRATERGWNDFDFVSYGRLTTCRIFLRPDELIQSVVADDHSAICIVEIIQVCRRRRFDNFYIFYWRYNTIDFRKFVIDWRATKNPLAGRMLARGPDFEYPWPKCLYWNTLIVIMVFAFHRYIS